MFTNTAKTGGIMEPIAYKKPEDRTVDGQYQDLLRLIFETGTEMRPIHGERAKMLMGVQLRYDMRNGFPVITERDFSQGMFSSAIAEHVAFLNGVRTQKELEKFGCPWWKRWVTKEKCEIFGLEEGDLGPGSYGAAWTEFPTAKGASFDQIHHVMRQLKERPFLRTHIISPWIPQYTIQHDGLVRRVVVAPCHGWIHIIATPETKELRIHHFQRSADMPVGVPFNMVQYATFGLMAAHLIGYTFVEYVHTFSDAHIYESQYDSVKELLAREPRKLPTVKLDLKKAAGIKNIKDFRPEHFILTDYNPHPSMKIPTPV
jgi:thymidylate synthase